MKDDSPFVFAGLWEGWKDPANDQWLHTCTIITGEPNEFVRMIHTRMPVILPEEHHESWLSGEAGFQAGVCLLDPNSATSHTDYTVSILVCRVWQNLCCWPERDGFETDETERRLRIPAALLCHGISFHLKKICLTHLMPTPNNPPEHCNGQEVCYGTTLAKPKCLTKEG